MARQRQLIWGATGIARVLFGEHAHARKRSLYSLIKRGEVPVFKLGRTWCAYSDQIENLVESKAREALAARPQLHDKQPTSDPRAFATAAE